MKSKQIDINNEKPNEIRTESISNCNVLVIILNGNGQILSIQKSVDRTDNEAWLNQCVCF